MIRRLFSVTKSVSTLKKNTALYKESDSEVFINRFFEEKLVAEEKKILMIRHALSEGNKLKLIYGLGDYDITQEGIQQARALHSTMSNVKDRFDTISSSKLKRTYQTGGTILGLGLNPSERDIVRNANFNEYDFGAMEGLYVGDLDVVEIEFFFRV